MPTYEYACRACGHRLEAVQKFTDEALTECPDCGGELRKVFNAPGIVLKGSGFYKTDTRAADKRGGSDSGGSGSGSTGASSGSDGPNGSKSETKTGDTSKSDSSSKSDAGSTSSSGSSSGSGSGATSVKESKPATSTST